MVGGITNQLNNKWSVAFPNSSKWFVFNKTRIICVTFSKIPAQHHLQSLDIYILWVLFTEMRHQRLLFWYPTTLVSILFCRPWKALQNGVKSSRKKHWPPEKFLKILWAKHDFMPFWRLFHRFWKEKSGPLIEIKWYSEPACKTNYIGVNFKQFPELLFFIEKSPLVPLRVGPKNESHRNDVLTMEVIFPACYMILERKMVNDWVVRAPLRCDSFFGPTLRGTRGDFSIKNKSSWNCLKSTPM